MLSRGFHWLWASLWMVALDVYATAPNPGCITVYQDVAYQGAQRMLCLNGNARVTVPRDNLFDDAITSIRVGQGVVARACENADGSGLCRTYFRSVANVWEMMNDKISTITLTAFNPDDFTLAFARGPEYPRFCRTPKDKCPNQQFQNVDRARALGNAFSQVLGNIVKHSNGEELATSRSPWRPFAQVVDHAGYLIGSSTVAGLVLNGPMTVSGNLGEMFGVLEYYRGSGLNVYPGLGKSDYRPGEGGCEEASCIKNAMEFMSSRVRSLNPAGFDLDERGPYYNFPALRKDHTGSLGYSWNIGNVHFIQVHASLEGEKQTFEHWDGGKHNRYTIRDAWDWLEDDLNKARRAGQKIVLLLNHLNVNDKALEKLIRTYRISAVFSSSSNNRWHKYRDVHGQYQDVLPKVLLGPVQFSMMLARFQGNKIRFAMIGVSDGGAYRTFLMKREVTLY